MLKEFSWGIFETSGNIEAYLVYRQVIETEKNIKDINFLDKIFAVQEVAISK